MAVVSQNQVFGPLGLILLHKRVEHDELANATIEAKVGGTVTQARLPAVHHILTEAKEFDLVRCNDPVAVLNHQVGCPSLGARQSQMVPDARRDGA